MSYKVSISECHNWVQNNIEQPGNGRITMSKFVDGSVTIELENGNYLEVMLRRPAKRSKLETVEIVDAMIFTDGNQLVDYVNPAKITLIA